MALSWYEYRKQELALRAAFITQTLNEQGTVSEASYVLGMDRTGLYNQIKRFDIKTLISAKKSRRGVWHNSNT
jgi:DNA-binding NtrC family response regulator